MNSDAPPSNRIQSTVAPTIWLGHRLFKSTIGLLAAGLISAAAFVGASDITHLYLRQDASMLMVVLCLSGALLAVISMPVARYRKLWPIVAYLLWSATTLIWSVAPASTVRATMWAVLYLCAALVGIRWPSQLIAISALTLIATLAKGVDALLVTQTSYLKGVWLNKNVQGAHFLLLGPLLFRWLATGRRAAPYFGLILGGTLFFASLTRAAAAQILLAAGILSLLNIALLGRERIAFRNTLPPILLMLITGAFLGFLTVRPPAVQVFGIGIGQIEGTSLDKTNTSRSLGHRVEMLRYALTAGVDAGYFGLGAGTGKEVYPGLKQRQGVNVADVHNFYAETFMTLGIPGLFFLSVSILQALGAAARRRSWELFTAIFLFSGYLAFEIPGYFPPLMMLYFGLLGAAISNLGVKRGSQSKRVWIERSIVLCLTLILLGAWSWWLQPCIDGRCAIKRKFAAEDVIVSIIHRLDSAERVTVATAAAKANPLSYWPLLLQAEANEALGNYESALQIYEQAANSFPYAHVAIYVGWHQAALASGNTTMAALVADLADERYGVSLTAMDPVTELRNDR